MKKLLFLQILLVLFSTMTTRIAWAQDHSEEKKMEQVMPNGEFIDLFHKEKGASVTPEAGRYIKACCKDRNAAIRLLKDNGFDVNIESDPERVKELNKHWKTTSKNYDEFISGSREPGILRFWDIFATYRIALFIKNNEVKRVWAVVDRTMP